MITTFVTSSYGWLPLLLHLPMMIAAFAASKSSKKNSAQNTKNCNSNLAQEIVNKSNPHPRPLCLTDSASTSTTLTNSSFQEGFRIWCWCILRSKHFCRECILCEKHNWRGLGENVAALALTPNCNYIHICPH